MDSLKLSSELNDELGKGRAEVKVVIALKSPTTPRKSSSSRQEKIQELKETFDEEAARVKDVISKHGGEITGSAWINRTLEGVVPSEALEAISELDEVDAIDIPRLLERE